MRGRVFSLVYPDETNVFGWGVELIGLERPRAVVVLPDQTGHAMLGTHGSAEGALRLWSKIEDLELKWLS